MTSVDQTLEPMFAPRFTLTKAERHHDGCTNAGVTVAHKEQQDNRVTTCTIRHRYDDLHRGWHQAGHTGAVPIVSAKANFISRRA